MALPDTHSPPPDVLLQMEQIVVRFGSLVANDGIDLQVKKGEIHALLGENGAGKTTLMKVLVGLIAPQKGEIFFNGKPVTVDSPLTAMELGIGMVHQHFMLIPTLTVAQNICIGLRSAGFPFPNLRQVSRRIQHLARQYRLHVAPDVKVAQLSVGAQQRVEIIKALYRGAKVLVLDEPTSVLTPQEADNLFTVIRRLAQQGNAVIFISHKLKEVVAISDRVTVLRHGKVIATHSTAKTSTHALARQMVGREVELPQVKTPAVAGAPPVVVIDDLHYTDERNLQRLQGITLQVHAGEIHGIAGVDGNGQEELAQLLAGLLTPVSGTVRLAGKEITHASPAQRIKAGIAYIPADRQKRGLVANLSLVDNFLLELNGKRPYSRLGFLNFKATTQLARELVAAYDIHCQSIGQKVSTLSGGNQQKVVLARQFFRNPRFIIATQPTRGLDVGATAYVHTMLLAQRRRGCAILLISTELDEIMALSDRISVLYAGQIMGTLSRETATAAEIGLMMAGKGHGV